MKQVEEGPGRFWIERSTNRFTKPIANGIEVVRADTVEALRAELAEKEKEIKRLNIRCLQYDAIVRGVCRDLDVNEDAGCDEIAMASANARELRANQATPEERAAIRGALIGSQSILSLLYHRESSTISEASLNDIYDTLCAVERAVKILEAARHTEDEQCPLSTPASAAPVQSKSVIKRLAAQKED